MVKINLRWAQLNISIYFYVEFFFIVSFISRLSCEEEEEEEEEDVF